MVNFGEVVPPGVDNFERVDLPGSPAPEPARTLPAARSQPTETARSEPEIQAERASPPPVAPAVRAGELSIQQLDQLCEAAREEAIAPLRAAAIAECKAAPRADPAYCERFYATYGDAVRLPTGAMRPRLFDDLPACVLAQEERTRRAR